MRFEVTRTFLCVCDKRIRKQTTLKKQNARVDRSGDECCMSASHNTSATIAGSHMRARALEPQRHVSRDLQGAQTSEAPHAVHWLQYRTSAYSSRLQAASGVLLI